MLFGKPESVGAEVSPRARRRRRQRFLHDSPALLTRILCYPRAPTCFRRCRGRASTCAAPKETSGSGDVDPQEDALGKITRITDPNWGKEPPATLGHAQRGCRRRNGHASPSRRFPAITGSSMPASAMHCWARRLPPSQSVGGMASGARARVGHGKLREAPRHRMRLERRARVIAPLGLS